MSNGRTCETCLFQDIRETSYEWIECFCRRQDGKRVGIKWDCSLYIENPSREEKIDYLCNLLKNADWELHYPMTAESKFIHQIAHEVSNYLVVNEINIKKED